MSPKSKTTKKQAPTKQQVIREYLKLDPCFRPVVMAYIKAIKCYRRQEARNAA